MKKIWGWTVILFFPVILLLTLIYFNVKAYRLLQQNLYNQSDGEDVQALIVEKDNSLRLRFANSYWFMCKIGDDVMKIEVDKNNYTIYSVGSTLPLKYFKDDDTYVFPGSKDLNYQQIFIIILIDISLMIGLWDVLKAKRK